MTPSAHIAGIALASTVKNETLEDLSTSAATKALLDAGITYSQVDHGLACFLDERERIPRSCFKVLGQRGAPICEVDNHAGLFTAVQYVRSGQSNCVLVVGIDRPTAVGLVIVSTLFLTSHAYLKDSSVHIRASTLISRFYSRAANGANDARTAKSTVQHALRQAQMQTSDLEIVEVQQNSSQHLREALGDGAEVSQPRDPWSNPTPMTATTGWTRLCRLVYQLRGWATDIPIPKARNCLQYTTSEDGTASALILCRSDGQPAPLWKDIKDVRDGRERLGYNPAVESGFITQEDFEAVRTQDEFTSDVDLMRLKLPIKGGDRAALARL